jgi:hypothetical protein
MSYASAKPSNVDENGRKPGEPHPDWEDNKKYLEGLFTIKKIHSNFFFADKYSSKLKPTPEQLQEMRNDYETKILCKWQGVEPNYLGNFRIMTHMCLSWKGRDGSSCSDVINLHQPHFEFVKEMKKKFQQFLT